MGYSTQLMTRQMQLTNQRRLQRSNSTNSRHWLSALCIGKVACQHHCRSIKCVRCMACIHVLCGLSIAVLECLGALVVGSHGEPVKQGGLAKACGLCRQLGVELSVSRVEVWEEARECGTGSQELRSPACMWNARGGQAGVNSQVAETVQCTADRARDSRCYTKPVELMALGILAAPHNTCVGKRAMSISMNSLLAATAKTAAAASIAVLTRCHCL